MKTPMRHTKVTVKLRKAEKTEKGDRWYLYLEAYPVFEPGKDKPKRVREYINRTITTPQFETASSKSKFKDGKIKRDKDGIILCKSSKDKQDCSFAHSLCMQMQQKYDDAATCSDSEKIQAELKERSVMDFIEYFKGLIKRHSTISSDSRNINWERVAVLLNDFSKGKPIPFATISLKLIDDFKIYLQNVRRGGGKSGSISQNTASVYFAVFKAGLKQAFIEGYFATDISAKVKGIPTQYIIRETLTIDELNKLVKTPCSNPIIKNAALFSALTGLRHCDIQKLTWGEIREENGHKKIVFTQKKTKVSKSNPISEDAFHFCGTRGDDNALVFDGLPNPSWISRALKKWITDAGITRNITFHCFRHTFATLQLSQGTDIYTVSDMLGHTNLSTTQVYAKVGNDAKIKASEAIKLDIQ